MEIAIKQANKESRMTRTVKSDLTRDLLSQGDMRGAIREQCIAPCDSKTSRDNGYLFNENTEPIIHTCEEDEVVHRWRKQNVM